jgi:hypothetical protein
MQCKVLMSADQLLKQQNKNVARQIIELIETDEHPEQIVDVLLQKFPAYDPDYRKELAEIACERFIAVVGQSQSEKNQDQLIAVFTLRRSEKIITKLYDAYDKAETTQAKRMIFRALGKCGGEEAAECLILLVAGGAFEEELYPELITALGNTQVGQAFVILNDIRHEVAHDDLLCQAIERAQQKIGNDHARGYVHLMI